MRWIQDPRRNRALQNQAAAVPQQEADRDRAENLDDGEEDRVIAYRLEEHVAIARVDLAKALVQLRLLPERLNGGRAGDALLQTGIEPRQHEPAFAIDLTRPSPVETADVENHGKDRQAHQRKPPVEPKHHQRDPENDADIAQEPNDASAEQLIERLDVVYGSRHQAAERIAIEICQVLFLEMRKYFHAQVVHRLLAGVLGRVRLNE
jgi:hypothetical protein